MSFEVQQSETVAEGLRRVAGERIDDALAALSRADREPDEAVHCVRKQVKKLRAIVRLVRDVLGEERYHAENDALRRLGRSLGEARDAAVAVETFDALVNRYGGDADPRGVAALRAALIAAREAAAIDPGDARQKRAIDELARGLEEARERMRAWPLDGHDFCALAGGLRRSYRRGKRAYRAAYDEPSHEAFHGWRKRVKDLWYQARLVQRAWPKMIKAYVATLDDLADLLGEDHDLAQLRLRVERIGAGDADAVAAVVRLIERRRLDLEAQARPLGKRLYAEPSKRFVKRIGTAWRAWRDGVGLHAVTR